MRGALAAGMVLWLAACALGGGKGAESAAGAAPQRIAVEARPNGIAVRSGDGALFITDDTTNSVLVATDQHSFTRYAALPAGDANRSLSQLDFAEPRLLLVARFGFGTAGALLGVAGPQQITSFAGPDPVRRRLGLAVIAPGKVLSTWFVKRDDQPANAPHSAGLSVLMYDTTTGGAVERDLLTGFGKPVGVAIAHGNVYVADAANNRIVTARLDTLLAAAQPAPAASATVFAQVDSPDLLAADSSGALYTKCGKTGFCRIGPDGKLTQLANDFHDARGVALDESRHTLYVVDRAAAGGTSYVRSLPLR
ncbi:hypothetical protein GCM10027093_64070 [Paraburkholderia jirisanensis]